MNVEAPPPSQEGFSKKHRNLLLASLAIIIFVVILVIPIVPIPYTVTKTRTRNLLCNAEMYFHTLGGIDLFPPFVNVTNQDSIGGSFSVTINYWNHAPEMGGQPAQLVSTFSQSMYIPAGTTRTFSPPSGWGGVVILFYDYSYSVSVPTTQENYDVTQTKYDSILTLIERARAKKSYI